MGNPHHETSDPLTDSWRIQSDASALGFDWPDVSGVLEKVREEIEETAHAVRAGDNEQAKRELGDVLFAAVNLARFLRADPGEELHRANQRFTQRFDRLKDIIDSQGLVMKNCPLQQLDKVWERIKKDLEDQAKNGA